MEKTIEERLKELTEYVQYLQARLEKLECRLVMNADCLRRDDERRLQRAAPAKMTVQ